MFAYVDDSGDSGFKFENGSSRYVVLVACIFESWKDVKKAWQLIDTVRCNQHDGVVFRRFDRGFKYNKTKMALKDSFFEIVTSADYSVRVIFADKAKLYSNKFRTDPNSLKSYVIRQLFTHTFGQVHDCVLCIDGRDTRAFGIADEEYILNVVNSLAPGTLSEVHFVDSKDSPLIQLADMTAGSVHAVLEKNSDDAKRHFATFRVKCNQPKGTYWNFTK